MPMLKSIARAEVQKRWKIYGQAVKNEAPENHQQRRRQDALEAEDKARAAGCDEASITEAMNKGWYAGSGRGQGRS